MQELSISLNKPVFLKKLFWFLLSLEILFVAFDVFFNYLALIPVGPFQRFFNMAREDSLIAWLAGIHTLFAGLILWFIYLKVKSRSWAFLATFFTYLGIDDGSKLHERIGSGVKYLINKLFQ